MTDFVEAIVSSGAYQEGLLATMVALRNQGIWDQEDLVANVVFLLFAGQETVVDMIGNSIMALHQNPQQKELLHSGSVPLGQAVSELLRYEPSVQFAGSRIAARDLQIGDLYIPAGKGAIAVLGSGNRDGSIFSEPDRLDLMRAPRAPSLSFAIGAHTCIGRNIALLELKIALEALYQYLPPWELNEAECVPRSAINFRGLNSAPARIV